MCFLGRQGVWCIAYILGIIPEYRMGELACILAFLFCLATQYAIMEGEK